jgi:hypothetical protein
MVVALALVIMWYVAISGRGYVVRIDFTFALPDAIGAEVVIDGEVVDTLHMLRRQPINGVRVEKGEHVVELRSENCEGRPFDVVPGEHEKSVSLFVHLIERTVDNRFVCTLALRR